MGTYIIVIIQYLIKHRAMLLRLVQWMAKIGFFVYVLYGIVAWFQPGTLRERLHRREALWKCLFSVLIGSGISYIIGKIWHRPRPFVAHPCIQALIFHKPNASFPSNHSMNSMAVATTLLACGNPVGWFFLPWSILLGASRVVCGVHYVTDVLGGFVIGIGSAVLVTKSRWSTALAQRCNWYYHIVTTIVSAWYRRW